MPRPLRGRYQTLGVVGAGGQGEVLCARDLVHDRLVAIKVRRVSSVAERNEILGEARALLDLRPHPGIALVRDDFFSPNRYHLVMDWVEGVNLAEWMAESDREGLAYADVLSALAQVADAIDHLHSHQPPVIHKDVKPSNILMDRNGQAVLVDFGLAGVRVGRNVRLGTIGFRAPEVSAGETPTAAADIFSLAATAHFLLTGQPPEPGANPSWRNVPPGLVPRVEMALRRGLALDPSRRPPTARALVELLSPPAVPHNLPAALTRFVGREKELSELSRVLRQTRLLTLAGIGGVGKTRLGSQLAEQESFAYPGGAWLVELGPLTDGAFVIPAIAKALGVQEAPNRSLLETLTERLRNEDVLIFLDNCEHLLDPVAQTAVELLKNVPGLRIIASSRQPLDIFGEVIYRVPPLAAPAPGVCLTAEDVGGYESAVLFCDRAARADPEFVLESTNADDVGTICTQLDGLPLALEMAAARLRDLRIHELRASLAARLDLAGARTAPSRQRTLAATVGWSYELLTAPAATLFRRLSVFVGGFTLEAIRSVCADDDVPTRQVGELLNHLVECSVVVNQDGSGGTFVDGARFGLLETLREYGAKRLAEEGKRELFADRHMAWLLSFAERLEAMLFGPTESEVLELFERDVDNFRLALGRALDRNHLELAFRLTRALSRFWNVRAYWSEGRGWLEEVLQAGSQAPADLRGPALAAAAVMAENQGDFQAATRHGEEGLRLAREVDDGVTAAEALNSLSNVAQARGDRDLSNRLLEDCLTAWRSAGTVRGAVSSFAGALGALGWRAAWQAQQATARRLFEEALVVAGELQIRRARVNCLMGLATVAEAEGKLAEAREHVDEARTISRQLGDKRFLGMQVLLDGLIALGERDEHEAIVQFEAAIREATASGDRVLFLRALEGIGRVFVARGELVRAVTLLGAASALRDALPWPVSPADRRWHDELMATLRASVASGAFEDAWTRGRAMSGEEAEHFVMEQLAPELTHL